MRRDASLARALQRGDVRLSPTHWWDARQAQPLQHSGGGLPPGNYRTALCPVLSYNGATLFATRIDKLICIIRSQALGRG